MNAASHAATRSATRSATHTAPRSQAALPAPARGLARARRALACCGVVAASLATALSASGGGEAAVPAGRFVPAAPLLVRADGATAGPARLDFDASQQEASSSNASATTFDADDDHCFVANHALVDAATGRQHFLQVTFRKRGQAVGVVRFGTDPLGLVEQARLAAPASGVSVDVAHRRIGFDHAVLAGPGGRFVLDGSYEFTGQPAQAAPAACG